jgi:acetoin utilization protein AcuB
MLVPDVKGTLAKITSTIAQQGGNIIALGTFLGADPTNLMVAIKVNDVPKDTLVNTLKPLVKEILDTREV